MGFLWWIDIFVVLIIVYIIICNKYLAKSEDKISNKSED
jgi:hypothetical protein